MGDLINFPKLKQQIMAEKKYSGLQAERIIRAKFKGAWSRWQTATPDERKSAVVPEWREKHAPKMMTAEQGAALLAEAVAERQTGGGVSPSDSSGGDYFEVARRIAKERGIKLSAAYQIVNKERPHLWPEMLRKANPGRSDEELFGKEK